MNNLTLIAAIFIILWVAVFAFYFVIVRNQKNLEHDIDKVESLLAENEHEEAQ